MERNQTAEDLNKSIDSLLDQYFADEESVEKSIDIAKDSEKTADEAVAKAPAMQKDEARNAGRSKDIHDQPQRDNDGQRSKDYDSAITENEDQEDEPEETDQSPAIDQASEGKGRMKSSGLAPKMKPFKKSEEIDDEEWTAFQEFKKSQAKAEQEEELKKARQEQEDLIKSAVEAATSKQQEEISDLKKSLEESNALIKAMASQPQKPKSVTNVSALEKSQEGVERDSFSKSEMLDAAEDLAKSKTIPADVVVELEMTGYVANPQYRQEIERKLRG